MAIFIPGGTGISGKVGNKPRLHVMAHEWQLAPAFTTDFWFRPGADLLTASAPQLLTALGWTSNGTVSFVKGSGADFLSSSDKGTPSHVLFDTSGERIQSPVLFGAYHTTQYIRDQFGWEPKELVADFVALWTTASNADTTGGVGFVEDGGAIQTANDHLAVITSDGTNFVLRSGAATSDASSAVDNDPHRWKIRIRFGDACYFYKDGVAVDTLALEADEFPVSFGMATTSSNVLGVGDVHVYYDG